MRYDTKITFYRDETKYNPKNSKREHIQKSWSIFANVTDLSTSKQVELLGGIKEGTKTVRLPFNNLPQWDFLTIEDNSIHYRFNSSIKVLKGFAMIVGKDNG
ncbi:hypothetical protein [Lactobacillus helveticus]|uniref:hypothetical protein n=1 Tax=Lactobacillus helveticus TaxID=1587 RepID=UPI0011085A3D|nr:hypothetical protein [Lactobacillus helveticus]TLQ21729.1 hypothetical protein FEZ38_06370 [Lactobacillus helveticus]